MFVVGDEYWCRERDKVIEVRGRRRVERILLERRGWSAFDTLVIAVAKPYRWFDTEFTVGNAALPIDEPEVLELAVESFVESIFSERRYRVRGEAFPRETMGLAVVRVPAPGHVRCGDRVVDAVGKYVVLKIERDCEVEYVRRD